MREKKLVFTGCKDQFDLLRCYQSLRDYVDGSMEGKKDFTYKNPNGHDVFVVHVHSTKTTMVAKHNNVAPF